MLPSVANEIKVVKRNTLFQLANVLHIKSAVNAVLCESKSDFDVLSCLHPSPAIGGVPQETIMKRIADIEPFNRGLYAGVLGLVIVTLVSFLLLFDHA